MIWYKNSLLKTISSGWNIEDFMSMSFVFLTNHKKHLSTFKPLGVKKKRKKKKQEACVVLSKSICFSRINESQIMNNQHYTFESSVIQAYLQQCVPSNTHLITLILHSWPLLKLFKNKSWACRIWVSNVNLINMRYSMSAGKQTLRFNAVFIKITTKSSNRVKFCIFMWTQQNDIPSLTDVHETNEKVLLSDPRDCPPFFHTHGKSPPKHKAYQVCLVCIHNAQKSKLAPTFVVECNTIKISLFWIYKRFYFIP